MTIPTILIPTTIIIITIPPDPLLLCLCLKLSHPLSMEVVLNSSFLEFLFIELLGLPQLELHLEVCPFQEDILALELLVFGVVLDVLEGDVRAVDYFQVVRVVANQGEQGGFGLMLPACSLLLALEVLD